MTMEKIELEKNCKLIKSSDVTETLEENFFYNEEESQFLCKIDANSFCCSFQDNAHKFTLEDLEEKRWQLINLQRLIVSLRQLQVKKKKSEAKLLKLAVNSKCKFIYPDIKMNMETSQKAAYENELVKSELHYLSNENLKQNHQDKRIDKENILQLLQNSSETIYKIFEGRVGHLQGDNVCAYVIISSEALYIVGEDLKTKLSVIPYENIEFVIVGKDDRWLAILGKELGETCYFQIDTGDSSVTNDIIKYLEISIRRRFIALSLRDDASQQHVRTLPGNTVTLPSNQPHEQVRNLNDKFGMSHSSFPLRNVVASKRIRFSCGRWLESLLPSVLSYSDQEVYYIENWLMEELKIKKRPQVLACWLVFWENGSEVWGEEAQGDPSPCLDGYLMVYSAKHNCWTPAYFLLKGGMLYRFCDSSDKLPQTVFRVSDYCGCQRLASNSRPHAFELMKSDENSLIFAAPNEEISSQWLHSFLRIISSKNDEYRKKLKLKPCQVIQTTESLILSYQKNILKLFRSKPASLENSNKHTHLPKGKSALSPDRDFQIPEDWNKFPSKGSLIPNSLKVNPVPLSSSVPININNTNNNNNNLETCPPTPPLPEFDPKVEEAPLELNCDTNANENKPNLHLLSFCNLDQISEIFVTAWPTNGCLMEFECSEASEIVGDWVLYFSSESQLSAFLKSILTFREKLTEEIMGLTKVSSGRIHDLLLDGARTSKAFWKPCNNRLN